MLFDSVAQATDATPVRKTPGVGTVNAGSCDLRRSARGKGETVMDEQVRGNSQQRQKQNQRKGQQYEIPEVKTSQEAKEGRDAYMKQMMEYAWEED